MFGYTNTGFCFIPGYDVGVTISFTHTASGMYFEVTVLGWLCVIGNTPHPKSVWVGRLIVSFIEGYAHL